jgi:hypothetical protein
MLSVERKCDRVVETVAATAIKAIATNPVILLCLVMITSNGPILMLLSFYTVSISGVLHRLGKMASSEPLMCHCRSDRRNLFTEARSPALARPLRWDRATKPVGIGSSRLLKN